MHQPPATSCMALLSSMIVLATTSSAATDVTVSTARAAVMLGITPEAIAASGLGDEAATILGRLEGASSTRSALELARNELSSQLGELGELETAIRRQPDQTDLIQSRDALRLSIQATRQEIAQLEELLLQTALAGTSSESQQRLMTYRESSGVNVPSAYRVVSRSDQEWLDIQRALRLERRANRRGEPIDSEVASLLADVRAEPAVTAAQLRIDSDLDDVAAVFEQYDNAEPTTP